MKTNIRLYTKQFYKNNIFNFLIAFLEVILVTAGMLAISWLLQQVTDLIAGNNNQFNLLELSIVASVIFVGCILSYLISYASKPRFITKGISQYKEFIFEKITKKNISAFVGENSSKYISKLLFLFPRTLLSTCQQMFSAKQKYRSIPQNQNYIPQKFKQI